MSSKIKPIDNLIEYLKSDKPFSKDQGIKLWEILKILADGEIKLDNSITINKSVRSTIDIPDGNIDGSNKNFILNNKPIDTFIAVFQNGLLLSKNTDYVIKDSLVTMTSAPVVGDTLQFIYNIQG